MLHMSEDIGLRHLAREFRNSLRTLRYIEGRDEQIKLAAVSQGVAESQADTATLCFSTDSARMTATYQRIALAMNDACTLKNAETFAIAISKADNSLRWRYSGYRIRVDSEVGNDAYKTALQVSPSFHRLYNTKVAAARAGSMCSKISVPPDLL